MDHQGSDARIKIYFLLDGPSHLERNWLSTSWKKFKLIKLEKHQFENVNVIFDYMLGVFPESYRTYAQSLSVKRAANTSRKPKNNAKNFK